MILNMVGGGGASTAMPEFTYTGQYSVENDGVENGSSNWRIKFLTSGVFKAKRSTSVEVFVVGGGGSGGETGSGGGGGYTKTSAFTIEANKEYQIFVGAGGEGITSGNGIDGGDTTAFYVTAKGGKGGGMYSQPSAGIGGSGGGACGGKAGEGTTTGGAGGTDGSDGGSSIYFAGGKGQGSTTREFGEASGDLYSPGGGGFGKPVGVGGEVGGGDGNGENGADNTGSGGGASEGGGKRSGAGGSGIVIIRNMRYTLRILEHPQDLTVDGTGDAVFEVVAAGKNLSYQWQRSTDGAKWVDTSVTGYNTPKITVNKFSYSNGVMYRCIVTDGKGDSVTSEAAMVTVVA